MASNYSLEKVALAWCQDTTKHKEMDSVLAVEFANILDAELAAMTKERDDMKEAVQKALNHPCCDPDHIDLSRELSTALKENEELKRALELICKMHNNHADDLSADPSMWRWLPDEIRKQAIEGRGKK